MYETQIYKAGSDLKYKIRAWAGEVAQKSAALVALAEASSLIPSTHMECQSCMSIIVPEDPRPSSGLCGYHTHMYTIIYTGKVLA